MILLTWCGFLVEKPKETNTERLLKSQRVGMYSLAMGVHLAVDIHSQILKASASQFFSFFNLENIHLLSASLIVVGYSHLNWVLFVTLEQVTSHSNWSGSWLEEVTHSPGGSASFFSVLLPAYLFQTWETDHWRFHLLSFLLSAYTSLVLFSLLCIIYERVSPSSHIAEELKHKVQLKTLWVFFRHKFQVCLFLFILAWWFFSSFLLRDCGVEAMVP